VGRNGNDFWKGIGQALGNPALRKTSESEEAAPTKQKQRLCQKTKKKKATPPRKKRWDFSLGTAKKPFFSLLSRLCVDVM
jgi:hypothetical protein